MTKLERSIPYRDWDWQTRIVWVLLTISYGFLGISYTMLAGAILLDWKIP